MRKVVETSVSLFKRNTCASLGDPHTTMALTGFSQLFTRTHGVYTKIGHETMGERFENIVHTIQSLYSSQLCSREEALHLFEYYSHAMSNLCAYSGDFNEALDVASSKLRSRETVISPVSREVILNLTVNPDEEVQRIVKALSNVTREIFLPTLSWFNSVHYDSAYNQELVRATRQGTLSHADAFLMETFERFDSPMHGETLGYKRTLKALGESASDYADKLLQLIAYNAVNHQSTVRINYQEFLCAASNHDLTGYPVSILATLVNTPVIKDVRFDPFVEQDTERMHTESKRALHADVELLTTTQL